MDYHTLLAAAQNDPAGADYHTLRMAYARSDQYTPYDALGDSVVTLRNALTGSNFGVALAAIDELLAFNYLDIDAHMAADYVYTQQENYERSAYHRAFARGLIQAIFDTGTGRDITTAWIVLSTSEEYTLLKVLSFSFGGQRLVEHEGHYFDVLTAKPLDGGDPVDLYFNIDLPFSHMGRRFQGNDPGHA